MLEALLDTLTADGVKLVAANSDAQALESSNAPYKIQLGAELMKGLGCGMKPEIGREAAIESKDEIRQAFLAQYLTTVFVVVRYLSVLNTAMSIPLAKRYHANTGPNAIAHANLEASIAPESPIILMIALS